MLKNNSVDVTFVCIAIYTDVLQVAVFIAFFTKTFAVNFNNETANRSPPTLLGVVLDVFYFFMMNCHYYKYTFVRVI